MAEASKSLGSVQFGPFELLLDTQELRKHGLPVKLSGQAIQILIVLGTHPGQLVTREELQRKLWPNDSYGDFEHGLNAAVNKLREKLGDSATTPTYVETLPGRGYRFIGKIGTLPIEAPVPTATEVTQPESKGWLWVVAALAIFAAVGATYWFFRPQMPVVTGIHQLTGTGSPKLFDLVGYLPVTDGTRVFFAEAGRVSQISTKGGEVSYIETPLINNPFTAGISNDGSQLLVEDWDPNNFGRPFWLVPLPNGPARRIPGRFGAMAFLPGHNQIAYVQSSDLKRLFTAKVDGSEARPLTSLPGEIGSSFAISPDGKMIRFATADNKMWEGQLDGTRLHRFLPERNNPVCCGNWSLDGKLYVFASRDQDRYNLWALPESGLLGSGSHPQPVQLTNGPIEFRFSTVSRDGKQILAVGETPRGELSVYDPSSGVFRKYLNGISAGFVNFSRDDQWIAYVTHPQGDLWRSRIDGSERLQLTFPPMGSILNPQWSPDSRFIAFTEWHDGQLEIYLVSADGGAPMLMLSGDFKPSDPSWSPDGRSIAYGGTSSVVGQAARTEVRILDLQTKQSRTIPGSQGLFSPRWSPDGRYIAALSEKMDQLFLYSFESDRWENVAVPRSLQISWPSWSHDSRYLYAIGDYIYKVRVPDGRAETVVRHAGIRLRCPALSWFGWFGLTPDDRVIGMVDRGFQEVYALDLEYR